MLILLPYALSPTHPGSLLQLLPNSAQEWSPLVLSEYVSDLVNLNEVPESVRNLSSCVNT